MLAHADPASYLSPASPAPAVAGSCAGWFGDLPDLLLESELAALTKIAPTTFQWWRQTGYGPLFERYGRMIRYPRSGVLTWISAGRADHGAYSILPDYITPGPMLTSTEVAELLRLETGSLATARWRRQGLAYFKLGRDAIRYALTDLAAYRSAVTLAHTN